MKHNKFKTLSLLIIVAVLSAGMARAQDPLPSWNDGPAKKAITEFVGKVTKEDSPDFVRRAARQGRPPCSTKDK